MLVVGPRVWAAVKAKSCTFEAKAIGHKAVGHKAVGHKAIGHKAIGHKAVGHKAVGHKAVGHKAVGHKAVGHKAVGHKAIGHKAIGHKAIGPDTKDKAIKFGRGTSSDIFKNPLKPQNPLASRTTSPNVTALLHPVPHTHSMHYKQPSSSFAC